MSMIELLRSALAASVVFGTVGVAHPVLAQQALPPLATLNERGPENQVLEGRVGRWAVTETVWERPGAEPVVTAGLVAEWRMIGSMHQEMLRSDKDTTGRDIKRIEYLRFNRVEGRWDYVSMEMRTPVGLMPAWSFDRGESGRIKLTFSPFSIAGGVAFGQMLRMIQTTSYPDQTRT